jgi:hypothetical protein
VAVHEVLGRHEAGDASLHVGVAIACLRVETVGAEVGYVGHPVVVEEDVVRFDVVVDDGRVRVLMQVQQPARHAHHHLVPLWLIRDRPLVPASNI